MMVQFDCHSYKSDNSTSHSLARGAVQSVTLDTVKRLSHETVQDCTT